MTNEQLRKAAVLVAALDTNTADVLLERMSPEQAAVLRRTIMALPEVGDAEQQAVLAEFIGRPNEANDGVEVSMSPHAAAAYAAQQKETAAGAAAAEAPFRFLHEADGDDLSELLTGEHPQTVAVVLSHLPPERAAAAVASLNGPLQADVVRRLARLDETDATVLADVEKELQLRFKRRFGDLVRASGVGAVRNILSEASPAVRRSVLSSLSRQDPHLASKLDLSEPKPRLSHADLTSLSDAALRELCESVDQEVLAVALAGDLELSRRMFAALPRGRWAQLQNAIDTLGPTPLSDVEWAQAEIVRLACELQAA